MIAPKTYPSRSKKKVNWRQLGAIIDLLNWTENNLPFNIYVPPPGFEAELHEELQVLLKDTALFSDELVKPETLQKSAQGRLGDLFWAGPVKRGPFWSQNVWLNPKIIKIDSIKDGAKKLLALGKYWALHSTTEHRRAQLIQEELPQLRFTKLKLGETLSKKELGAWTLLDRNTLVASSKTGWNVPDGKILLEEDKLTPPNRAYLKLMEVFARFPELRPQGQGTCLDLGSSPGGWTWVLQQLGGRVISVDKADLDFKISQLPNIEYLKRDAFQLKPSEVGPIHGLFCDVICFPERLLELIFLWKDSGFCDRFVCTIKLKGKSDFKVLEHFHAIPNSKVLHLCHNKNELTWVHDSSLRLTAAKAE